MDQKRPPPAISLRYSENKTKKKSQGYRKIQQAKKVKVIPTGFTVYHNDKIVLTV